MRTALCALSLLLAVACGGSHARDRAASGGEAWNVTAKIPADTPYLFATLTPFPEAVLDKVQASYHREIARAVPQLEPMIARSSAPWAKVGLVLLKELSSQPPAQWWQSAGFAAGGRFVVYGLSLWPVLRVEVAQAEAVSKTIRRALTTAGLPAEPTRQGTWDVWQLDSGPASVVIGVSANEAVVSAMPTQLAARALPWILGTQRPARSLADTGAVTELMRQHGLLPQLVGMMDLRAILSILSGNAAGIAREFSEALRVPTLAGCASDVDRLAGLAPRLVFGYDRIDSQSLSGGLVAEMPPHVVASLRRLVTAAPGVTWPLTGKPLFAMAAAIDVGAAMTLLGELGNELQAHPFTCPGLAELNRAGPSWSNLASTPVPPIVTGLRGFSLVLDEATLDPPGGVGHVLVVGKQLDTLPTWLAMIPGLSGLSLQPNGTPTALPVDQLGVAWVSSAHAALRSDRLVVTVGRDSARRAAEQLKEPVPQRSPLLAIAYDVARLSKLWPDLATIMGSYPFREANVALDLGDQGLRMIVDGTW